jgi:hypothetical protein
VNTYNTNLPTSTLTPTTNFQLTNKAYVDSSGGTGLLSATNTWTSTNTYNNIIVGGIQEKMGTSTGITISSGATSGNVTIDYTYGTIFTIPTSTNVVSNYALRINNLPSLVDTSKTYVVNILNPLIGNASFVANTIIFGAAAAYTTRVPILFNGGNSIVYNASVAFSSQQVVFVYSTATMYTISSVGQFY